MQLLESVRSRDADGRWMDERTTFLRWHVPEEIRNAEQDILAIAEIKARLVAAGLNEDAGLDEQINAIEFFYRDLAEQTLYIPVRLFDTKNHKEFASLTNLIEETRVSPHGILLESRSGAGKTVACWKAFYDCLYPPPPSKENSDPPPLLHGFIPCWVRDRGNVLQHDQAIEELILKASGLPDSLSVGQIREWLRYGPPLLLFFDLNKSAEHREIIARALITFQQHYRDRGHRCIVTYRSTNEADPVLQLLKESTGTPFRSYDLRPLAIPEARGYLRALRKYEAELRQKFDLPDLRAESIDKDCAKLEELAERHARDRESVISTPLLMHFVSSVDSDKLQAIDTLWDLYFHVVDRHLERDDQYSRAMQGELVDPDSRRSLLMIAMCRAALAILAEDPNAVDIAKTRLIKILRKPDSGKKGPKRWWPLGDFWHASAYFTTRFTDDLMRQEQDLGRFARRLLEFSMFRADDGKVRFLHDSFIYFFAAYALRFFDDPLADPLESAEVLPDEWFPKVVERIRENPEAWKLPAEFLGGALVVKPSHPIVKR